MIGDTPYDAEAASGAGTCSRRASYRWVCKQALLEAGPFRNENRHRYRASARLKCAMSAAVGADGWIKIAGTAKSTPPERPLISLPLPGRGSSRSLPRGTRACPVVCEADDLLPVPSSRHEWHEGNLLGPFAFSCEAEHNA
jgi:hypothetical protein